MADQFDTFDKILRQKFENFSPEPPMQVWENIKTRITGDAPPHNSAGFVLPMIFIVSMIIFLSGLLHHIFDSRSDTQILASEIQGQHFIQPSGAFTAGPAANPGAPLPAAIPVRVPFQRDATPVSSNYFSPAPSISGSRPDATLRTGLWQSGLRRKLAAGDLTYADAINYNLTHRDMKKLYGFRDYEGNKRASWSLGLYFHPEVTSYRETGLGNTISYSFSILPQLSFNHFFIQSGASLRSTYDKGNYSIDFNRYLGSYEHVHLVTFDTTENGVIPTYHTHTVEVYDTIDHYVISETRINYTFLEIPVLFGYQHSFGRFSLFVKAGPAASFMIIKRLPDASNPEEKARIVNVDYQVPVRSTVNWQLQLGAGFEYKLSDKLGFNLEPTFRLALDPEYETPAGAGARSYTYGVRAGLKYIF